MATPHTSNDLRCAACGTYFDESQQQASASITIRGPESWNDPTQDAIIYEWWQHAKFCPTCNEKFIDALIDAMPLPERYDSADKSDAQLIEAERLLIAQKKG